MVDQHKAIVDETMETIQSAESTRQKGNRSKRDRITFRMDNAVGMQMQTEK